MKRQILKTLLHLLEGSSGIKYVAEPQSPFVMDNPDVLAIAGSSLFGIYVPNSHECKNIDSFLRRVYTSRLVYARDLKTILLVNADTNLIENKILCESFHRVLDSNHIEEVISIIVSDQNDETIKMLSKKVRTYALENYYKYISLYHKARTYNKKFVDIHSEEWQTLPIVKNWAYETKGKTIKSGYYADGFIIFSKPRSKGMNVRESLDGIMTYSMFNMFSLDNGQLYLNESNPQLNLLNTDLFVNDDMLWTSSLAYVGVTPISVDSLQLLNAIHNEGLKIFSR